MYNVVFNALKRLNLIDLHALNLQYSQNVIQIDSILTRLNLFSIRYLMFYVRYKSNFYTRMTINT